MIQFNLLPDIKQEFVKVNRMKRVVLIISILSSGAFLLVFLLFLSWDGLQRANLSNINNDISTYEGKLKGTSNVDNILTAQNQLNSLPTLYGQNPMASRLFGYLSQVTPSSATISTLSVNFQLHTVQITGNADSLTTVNVFADTLKFTTYSLPSQPNQKTAAFTNVVLASFSVSKTGTDYTFTFDFDPNLFSNSNTLSQLTVPPETTTRSVLDSPSDLFKQSSGSTTNGS